MAQTVAATAQRAYRQDRWRNNMPVCYCKNSGGYGRFLQVIEQKPVKPEVEEEQEAEPDKHLTKRKLHQLEPLKPSKRETIG